MITFAPEYIVIRSFEAPGASSDDKTYRLMPGQAISFLEIRPDGEPWCYLAGWYGARVIPLDQHLDKLVDLRLFFSKVAKLVEGTFIPPRDVKVFIIETSDRIVRVTMPKYDDLEAEIWHTESNQDDYSIKLSPDDFKDPAKFRDKVFNFPDEKFESNRSLGGRELDR